MTTLLPAAVVLLASALLGGLVPLRQRWEATSLCFALLLLTGFDLQPSFLEDSSFEWGRAAFAATGALIFGAVVTVLSRRQRHAPGGERSHAAPLCLALAVLGSLEFPRGQHEGVSLQWQRAALVATGAVILWAVTTLPARRSLPSSAEPAHRRSDLSGVFAGVSFFLLVAAASYTSVAERTGRLKLYELAELNRAIEHAQVWLALPLTVSYGLDGHHREISSFALALAVSSVGGVLALAVRRVPEPFERIAVRATSALVISLVVAGLVVLFLSANRPSLLNPYHVVRHVYDWAVLVGSLSVMLAFGRPTAFTTLWLAVAVGSVGAVKTAEHAIHFMWGFAELWPEFTKSVMLRAASVGVVFGLAGSRLARRTDRRLLLAGLGCLTLPCTLLAVDGMTWFSPSPPQPRESSTSRCLEELPGPAYRIDSQRGDLRTVLSRARPPAELVSHVVIHAPLDSPVAEVLPSLQVAAEHDLPLYVYGSYLESVDLLTMAPFHVTTSSCALASAPLDRLRQEQPSASARSIRELLTWLRAPR